MKENVEKVKLYTDQKNKLFAKWKVHIVWDFQLNDKVVQQSHEDQLLLNLVEILNVSSENGRESSLNILLEEVLAADAIEETAVIGDEIGRV